MLLRVLKLRDTGIKIYREIKYFDEEIKARDLAREEAKRIDSLEEGDIMEKNNDLKNIVVDSKSSPTVKLTPQEKAKQKALLQI